MRYGPVYLRASRGVGLTEVVRIGALGPAIGGMSPPGTPFSLGNDGTANPDGQPQNPWDLDLSEDADNSDPGDSAGGGDESDGGTDSGGGGGSHSGGAAPPTQALPPGDTGASGDIGSGGSHGSSGGKGGGGKGGQAEGGDGNGSSPGTGSGSSGGGGSGASQVDISEYLDSARAAAAKAKASTASATSAATAGKAAAAKAKSAATDGSVKNLRQSPSKAGTMQYQDSAGTWHDTSLTAASLVAAASSVVLTDSAGNPLATVSGTLGG